MTRLLLQHPLAGLAVALLLLASIAQVFSRAGKPGWAAFVPIYNIVLLCELAGQPRWLTVAYFVPVLNIIAALLVNTKLSRRFGKGPLFGVGLTALPMIFWPVLGFGRARYRLYP
jgi:hypothetical protein